jgi:YVTN family beta-propeller protein
MTNATDILSASRVAVVLLALVILSACGKRREGAFAYVSNERGGTVSVIDTTTDKVISTISVGARPRGIRVSPDHKLIYVALSYPSNKREGEDKIAAIDVASEKIVEKIDVGSDPERFAITRDGKRIYVSNEDAGTASVIDVDSK